MGGPSLGTSLFLIALGAILRFAVTASVSGLDLATVGLILMIVGIIGLIISVLYMTMATERRRDATVVREREPLERDPRYR